MNIDYFIKKFEAIPDENWIPNYLSDGFGKCCVLGHCGLRPPRWGERFQHTPESKALVNIFATQNRYPAFVNNGTDPDFQQATPKARVLAALEYLKGITHE